MKFTVENPDEKRSPYTGMTREHWIGISHFFLEGIFEHVEKLEDPIVVLRHETRVSYPQPDGPKWRIAAERFEGLARSFLIAAPLLSPSPRLTFSIGIPNASAAIIWNATTVPHPWS